MRISNTRSALQQCATSTSRLLRLRKRMLILGTGQHAKELGQVLVSERDSRYELIGFLDRDPSRVGEQRVNPSVIGTFDRLFQIVEQHDIGTIAVCLEDRRNGLPVDTLLDFKTMGVEVLDGHQLFEQESGRLSIDLIKPSALIFSTGFRRFRIVMVLKRLIDFIASALGLIALAPVFCALAILIKLDSPGSVFYRQLRVGIHAFPYVIWKLRSMYQNAESRGAVWASLEDPRVTRVGRWLRKWRIDELPQLINVLKGDMSLVGPRPERPAFVQQLRGRIPYYDLRHTVRPGISGWAQIKFRYAASAEDAHLKLQYDLYYVKNLSLVLDARILLETVRVVLLREGAR